MKKIWIGVLLGMVLAINSPFASNIFAVELDPTFGPPAPVSDTGPGGSSGTGPGGDPGTGPGGAFEGGITFPNPLKANSLQCLIYQAFRVIINVLAILAALYLIWSGFKFVAAQGNPEKLKEARRSFFNTLIGVAIILGAWAITTFVVNTVNELLDEPVAGIPTLSSCSNSDN